MLLKQIVNTRSFPLSLKAPSFENAVLGTLDEPVIGVESDDEFARLIDNE